jgi:threonine/homoserine/homoserine lactone efflux protein
MLGNLNGGNAARLLLQGVTLARRYPFVLSGLSALFLRGSRRSRLLKVAAAGVAGWQGYRMWQRAQEAEHPAEGAAYPVPPVGRGIS